MDATVQHQLTRQAVSATVHCLTGCAVGEILGMVLATWWGWSNAPSVVLSIVLAFLFGYSLTVRPVMRSGLSLGKAVGVAVAADTVSMLVAFVITVPVNRLMLSRSKGHAVAHRYH